jgi:hypothetical protein
MNTLPNKFRPSSAMNTKSIMRERRKYGRTLGNYNWQSRVEWYPVGFKLNRKTIFKQFGKLHYLACHSPKPITKKWQKAYDNFFKKHFGRWNGTSVRYLNKWSCHNWL